MSLLSVKDASFIYSQKTPFQHTAVDHVSFDVEQGDFIGIIGHTGSDAQRLVKAHIGFCYAGRYRHLG